MTIFGYLIYRIRPQASSTIQYQFTSVGSNLIICNSNIWALTDRLTEVDISGKPIRTLAAGAKPVSALSMGAYIWVCNYDNAVISEILVTNGVTKTYKTGRGPNCCAFDGLNIWVTNYYDGTCSIIAQSSGKTVTTVKAGDFPSCCLFDGKNMWVTLQYTGEVLVFDIASFSVKNKFKVGSQPLRMSSFNNFLYVLNSDSTITKVNFTGGVRGKIYLTTDAYTDIVADGTSIWASSTSGNIVCYDINTGASVSGFASGIIPTSLMIINKNIVALDSKTGNQIGIYTKPNGLVINTTQL